MAESTQLKSQHKIVDPYPQVCLGHLQNMEEEYTHTHTHTHTHAHTHARAREYKKLRPLNNNWPYIKVNDAVLIHEDNAPRHLWGIGRVIELIKSKSDNEVRRASVKFPRTVERYNGPSTS